jgi:hypothetical protein
VLDRRLLAAGQGEQVVDQAGHAVAGPLDHGHGVAQVVGVGPGVGQGDVDVGADDGQGVAQLVGGVGDELALGGEGRVQPGQHGVEGVGQLLELVVGAGQLDPA